MTDNQASFLAFLGAFSVEAIMLVTNVNVFTTVAISIGIFMLLLMLFAKTHEGDKQ